MSDKRILVVDDEEHIVELIKFNLEKEGCTVFTANSGDVALKIAKDKMPDLILLDLMLPGIDGLEVCKLIRKDENISEIPIIMITAKSEEIDKIVGLEIGADDYITKPFSVREMVARVKAIMRRTSNKKEVNNFSFDNIYINFDKHEVKSDGE